MEWYHIVLTMSFKLVSFFYIYWFNGAIHIPHDIVRQGIKRRRPIACAVWTPLNNSVSDRNPSVMVIVVCVVKFLADAGGRPIVDSLLPVAGGHLNSSVVQPARHHRSLCFLAAQRRRCRCLVCPRLHLWRHLSDGHVRTTAHRFAQLYTAIAYML